MGEPTPKESIPIYKPPAEQKLSAKDDEVTMEIVDYAEMSESSLVNELISALNKLAEDKTKSEPVNEIMDELRDRDEKLAREIQNDVVMEFVPALKNRDQIMMAQGEMLRKLLDIRNRLKK